MTSTKKEALLAAAKELFGEYGYSETTFKKISERAGVALGLLTHHYGSKEKLFLASGLSVLENFEKFLSDAVKNVGDGYRGVMKFCEAYLDFSLDPNSNWLVLVRCSPYSDMKTRTDCEIMASRFESIHAILLRQIERGVADGSIREWRPSSLAQVIMSVMVGVNRTRALTPYASPTLYADALEFISSAISPRGAGSARENEAAASAAIV